MKVSFNGGATFLTVGYVDYYNVDLHISSPILTVPAGLAVNVDSTSLQFGATSMVGVDGTFAVPDVIGTWAGTGTNQVTPLTIVSTGGDTRRMDIHVAFPTTLDFGSFGLNAAVTGYIVAYATVPEPATISMLGLGLACFALPRVRKRLRKSMSRDCGR